DRPYVSGDGGGGGYGDSGDVNKDGGSGSERHQQQWKQFAVCTERICIHFAAKLMY
ncbi:hypothetical protein C5167_035563, partial [Papaver somniferum]